MEMMGKYIMYDRQMRFSTKKICESCMSGLGVQKQPKNEQKTCFSAINWSQMVK